ncbi:hypothetical protein [Maricaulis sp.]|uniref:hypothetical protein n=1 Tax=Maricaulis sp. TaxID=1486257 RepID=UPI002630CE8A|nr:hypothetical protein [Maricaulis sp.]
MMWDFVQAAFPYLRLILSLFVVAGVVYAGYLTVIGFLPALWRLGNGLRHKKIAVFASGDTLTSLVDLLGDTKLFTKKNIVAVSRLNDLGRAENAQTYLVHWPDWGVDGLRRILTLKKDQTALVVYAPHAGGRVDNEAIDELERHRNVVLVNFRGRLLNDIIISMITAGHE